MHHIIPMQKGHPVQDLLGQSDHIFLCEGFVVVRNTLVEDLATGGAGRKTQEGKLNKKKLRIRWEEHNFEWITTQWSLAWLTFICTCNNKLLLESYKHTLPLSSSHISWQCKLSTYRTKKGKENIKPLLLSLQLYNHFPLICVRETKFIHIYTLHASPT